MDRRVLRPILNGAEAAGAFGDEDDLLLRLRLRLVDRVGVELEASDADVPFGEAAELFPVNAALSRHILPGQVRGAEMHRVRHARPRILDRPAVLVFPDRLVCVLVDLRVGRGDFAPEYAVFERAEGAHLLLALE